MENLTIKDLQDKLIMSLSDLLEAELIEPNTFLSRNLKLKTGFQPYYSLCEKDNSYLVKVMKGE